MADLVAGGIIGVVFAELYKAALELAKFMTFQPILGEVTSTLGSLNPLIQELVSLNINLKLSSETVENLRDEIMDGLVLVRKCVKCPKYAIPKIFKYNKKLGKLNVFLKRLLETLNTEEMLDVKLNYLLTTEISKKVDQMANDVKEILLRTEKHGGLLYELSQDEKANLELGRKHSDQLNELAKDTKQLAKDSKQLGNVVRKKVIKKPSKESSLFNRHEVMASSSLPVGLDEPLKELKKNLLKDGVSMLVLTGPQGSGKTTLAKQFCQDEEVKGKFKNNIFFVLVSEELSWEHIVQQVNDKFNKSQLPKNINEEVEAVKWLQQFLNEAGQNPLLLVLDNVWSGSEFLLEKLNEFKMSNYKILVTSIYEFPRFTSRYNLKPLNDDDAMTLFQHSASRDESSSFPVDLAKEIVERCRGFPLAIEKVGKSVCYQPIEFWLKTKTNWYESSSMFDSETDFFGYLPISIDALGKEETIIQECFMDLGSFPENQRISVEALMDIWAVLHELDKDILSIRILNKLTNQSLANHVITRKEKMDVDGYYSAHFLTQHYMLRQLAIYQTQRDSIENRKRLIIDMCRDNLPIWLKEQTHQPVKARLLSISTDGRFSMEWPNMQLPKVEVLILNFQTKNYALPGFVEKMEKLQVLIVTNYGSTPAGLRKFDLLRKLSHLKRIRLQNISIASITKIAPTLKSLQKISLFMCSIAQAVNSCRIRISGALPNLVEMNIDCCDDLVEFPENLCCLTSLKKLSITNCYNLSTLPAGPEGIGKLINLELLRLRSCKDLLKLPDSIRNLKMLELLDISDCLSLKTLPEHIGELSSLRKLNMRHSKGLKKLPGSILNLKQLEEVMCDEVTEELWEPFLAKLSIKLTKEDMST